jgi:hypothetical protein
MDDANSVASSGKPSLAREGIFTHVEPKGVRTKMIVLPNL